MGIRAILFGATGMVGEGVLHEALASDAVEQVLVVGRRSCAIKHPKLREIIHRDFFDYTAIKDHLRGYTACFFCLGVSSIGMSEYDYNRLTYNLTIHAATALSHLNPGMVFCYVSGMGTDSTEQGRMMWARVKGKTENQLLKLPFKDAYFFRPGYIKPTKGLKHAHRLSIIAGTVYPLVAKLIPKYGCTLRDLGQAMLKVVEQGYSSHYLENEDITKLANLQPEPVQVDLESLQ